MVHVNKDVERKAVKFAVGLVIAVAIFCVWLASMLTNDNE